MTIAAIMRKTVPIVFNCAYILFQLIAMSVPGWVTVREEGKEYAFSLVKCEDCPATMAEYTPECFLSFACSTTNSLCRLVSRLASARDLYFTTALISLLAALLVTLSQLYKGFGYIGEHSKVVYTCLLVQVMGCGLGVVTWFGETKANFTSSDRAAEVGPELAVAGLIMCVLGAGGVLLNELRGGAEMSTESPEIGKKTYLGLTLRQWLYVKVFPLLTLALSFDVLSLNSNWIQYRTSVLHTGTLLSVDSYLSVSDIAYSCISGPACALDSPAIPDMRYCNSFPPLITAGTAYLWLDGLTLAAMVLWLESGVYFALGVEYGVPRLNYCWPVFALLAKVVGLVVWLGVSQADLYATCETSNVSSSLQLCVTDGFVYALWQLFCMSISAAFYIALYYSRRNDALLQVVPSASPALTFPLAEAKKHQSTMVEGLTVESQGEDPNLDKDPKLSLETSGFVTMRDVPSADCVVCGEEKSSGDIRFELPCQHWVHIGCFGKGGGDRRACPKCELKPAV